MLKNSAGHFHDWPVVCRGLIPAHDPIMKSKKYLSFTSLRKVVSTVFLALTDMRRQKSVTHTLHDSMMSGLACMFFQEPSLLQFQRSMEDARHNNNLRTMFDVQSIPSDTQLGAILDPVADDWHRDVFRQFVNRLQRSNQLQDFQLFPGKYLVALDGTQYFSSEAIHCKQCLHKEHRDGTTTYQHFALQASMMHPGKKQVIPMIAEDIRNTDGKIKQDCEANAAKRLIVKLRQNHPKMGIILGGDDLFSRNPMIENVKAEGMSFIFVAKPSSHTSMIKYLAAHQLSECFEEGAAGSGTYYHYQWTNDVPLTGDKDSVRVNYFSRTVFTQDATRLFTISKRQSWVTDINVDASNVSMLVKGGLCRWKIENECFNTLKNQGYHLEHNYGHGEQNLSYNMYLLTLLAFFLHQIQELTEPLYQACRKKHGSKQHLWERLRTYIKILLFDDWEHLLEFALAPDKYLPERAHRTLSG